MSNQAELVINLGVKIEGYQKQIDEMKKQLARVGADSDIGKSLATQIQQAERKVTQLSNTMNQKISSGKGLEKLTNQMQDIEQRIDHIGASFQDVRWEDLGTDELQQQLRDAQRSLIEFQNQVKQLQSTKITELLNQSKDLRDLFQTLKIDPSKMNMDQIAERIQRAMQDSSSSIANLKTDLDGLNQRLNDAKIQLNQAAAMKENFSKGLVQGDINSLIAQRKEQYYNTPQLEDFVSKTKELLQKNDKLAADFVLGFNKQLEKLGELPPDQLKSTIKTLNDQYKSAVGHALSTDLGYKNINQISAAVTAGGVSPEKLAPIKKQLEELFDQNKNFNLSDQQKIDIFEHLFDPAATLEQIDGAKKQLSDAIQQYAQSLGAEAAEAQKTVDQLMSQTTKKQTELTAAETKQNTLSTAQTEVQALIQPYVARIEELEETVKTLTEQVKTRNETAPGPMKDFGQQLQHNAAKGFSEVNAEAEKYSKKLDEIDQKQELLGHIESFVKRWFSITAAIDMVEKALHSVVSTVQELDAVMTEIAIVTDKTQADLWGQMASYTAMAEQYAASISGVYEVSQLYYQQG